MSTVTQGRCSSARKPPGRRSDRRPRPMKLRTVLLTAAGWLVALVFLAPYAADAADGARTDAAN